MRQLGFTNKLSRSTIKSLSSSSIRASFYIWLARNCKTWTPKESLLPFKNFQINKKEKSSRNNEIIKIEKIKSFNKQKKSVFGNSRLINKGNTCYANAILQSLNALPLFFQNLSRFISNSFTLSNACLKILKAIRTSGTPVDPSHFLLTLKNILLLKPMPAISALLLP